MLRLIVTKTDVGAAVHAGGEVELTSTTHLIDYPALEEALKESDPKGYVTVSLSYELL